MSVDDISQLLRAWSDGDQLAWQEDDGIWLPLFAT